MATVHPFRGVTYEPTRVPDLATVTCPPYDVISDADRVALYGRDAYNIVRVVSGRDEPDDEPGSDKYSRACGFFRSWIWEGVLREDPAPALYVYRQAFADPCGNFRRVWGLLASISLDDRILAHERTMSGPKADRLALMRAVPANLSPIYALYRQDGGGVSAALADQAGAHPPVADFADDEGTRHTVWAVHDEAWHAKVAAALAASPLLIADGHHRFETAKIYRDARRATDGPGEWDRIMTLLVDAGAQPVCILPYHRIVRACEADDVLATLRDRFEVTPLPDADPSGLGRAMWDHNWAGAFVVYVGSAAHRLDARQDWAGEVPAGALKRLALDTLGAGDAEGSLAFTPHATEVAAAAAGGAACGFLLPPVSVAEVWDLAASGAKMPEKSTYFFPKPRDGIVIRPLAPCDTL